MASTPQTPKNAWRGKKIVITAGPTREYIDPVRFLTNASSGRMGYALAEAAQKRKAQVVLISGPTALTPPAGVRVIPVVSAEQMLKAVLRYALDADLFIGTAAVADWRPAHYSPLKLKKKKNAKTMALRLARNPDILKTLSERKRGARPSLVGFALETDQILRNALEKLEAKKLDMIVANAPSSLEGADTRAWLLTKSGGKISFKGTKPSLAEKMLDVLEKP